LRDSELIEKKKRLSDSAKASDGTPSPAACSKQLKQTQIHQSLQGQPPNKFDGDHPKQKLITEKIAHMICKDLQPYTIVEDPGFRAVIKAAEPKYVMPSRKTFSAEIIPKLYTDTYTAVKSEVQLASCLAFTTDAWTSRANNGYLSYTVHFLTANFEMRNYCLAVENVDESHTAANLANSLSEQTNAWTSDSQRAAEIKIAVVSDNAANVQAAISKVPSCISVKCFDHTLQLAINDAVQHCTELKTCIQKAKSITTHFKHSSQNTKKLMEREKQLGLQQLKLKQECITRWNSKFDMLERLVFVKDAVSSVVASVKNVQGLSASEWEVAEEYVNVFKPFKVLTATMSSATSPTISMVIPELNKLKHILQNDCGLEATCLPTLREDLVSAIDHRWPQYEANRLYAISTYVDPRYKDCGFSADSCAAFAHSLVLSEMTLMSSRQSRAVTSSLSSSTTSAISGMCSCTNVCHALK
jgi:hypothetical protein